VDYGSSNKHSILVQKSLRTISDKHSSLLQKSLHTISEKHSSLLQKVLKCRFRSFLRSVVGQNTILAPSLLPTFFLPVTMQYDEAGRPIRQGRAGQSEFGRHGGAKSRKTNPIDSINGQIFFNSFFGFTGRDFKTFIDANPS